LHQLQQNTKRIKVYLQKADIRIWVTELNVNEGGAVVGGGDARNGGG